MAVLKVTVILEGCKRYVNKNKHAAAGRGTGGRGRGRGRGGKAPASAKKTKEDLDEEMNEYIKKQDNGLDKLLDE